MSTLKPVPPSIFCHLVRLCRCSTLTSPIPIWSIPSDVLITCDSGMKQWYLCQCALKPGEHSVLKSERVTHTLALQQHKVHQDSDIVGAMEALSTTDKSRDSCIVDALQQPKAHQGSDIVGAMEALSMTDKSRDSCVVDAVEASKLTDDVNIDSLSNLVTALTLTDEGPNLTEQPSKLWSSRSQFQASKDSQLPARMGGVPYSEIEPSVRAVLNNEQPSVPVDAPPSPSAHPIISTAPSAPSKSSLHSSAGTFPRSPATPPATTPKLIPSCSSAAKPWQRSGLPRPDAFTPPSKPTGALVRKALDIIVKVEEGAHETEATLFLPDGFDNGNTAQVAQMRALLDAAAAHVDSAGRSLKLIQRKEQEVIDRKQSVINLLKAMDARISVLGTALPPPPPEATPVFFDAAHVYDNPVEKLDTIAQIVILLGVVCNVIMGLGTDPCNFIIGAVTLLVKMAMATRLTKGADGEEYDGNQRHILDQLPTSLYTSLNRFKIDSQTTMYAVCPTCNCTFKASYDRTTANASYPARCTNRIAEASGSSVCGTALLEERNGHLRPIKTYLVASFTEYLAQLLSNATIEHLCDKACDDAMDVLNMPHDPYMKNVFNAEFMKTFEGPTPGQLFIDRGNKVRLAFAIQADFFHPNGSRRRGNHDSIGIISLANLNLPESIRYQPENMFLAGIIPGPQEPEIDDISHFLRPIIDECVVAWKPGIHISKTASCPEGGRDVEVAIVISVNDLPAARKVSGTAGVRSNFHCTVCSNYGDELLYNTDFDKWKLRDATEMRRQAEAFRDAQTSKDKDAIFTAHGVRWSEFWRLPYWNPSRMLVIDSMHCILEGLVHYHCRHVLQLDAQQAKAKSQLNAAFSYPWIEYSSDVPMEYRIKNDKEKDHISDLHESLALPLDSGPNSITEDELRTKLLRRNLPPLKFVCYSLGLRMEVTGGQNGVIPARTKRDFANLLINWRRNMPLSAGGNSNLPKTTTPQTLDHIQRVIRDTVTPSWINSVPKNYGEASAGTIKADEWRILSTVYLPIALVTLWGEENGAPPEDGSHFLSVLDHTMALFQAVTIACRYTMTVGRATAYRNFIKQWVDGLYKNHPHTVKHKRRQNVHAALHIYDFLLLFGPVISWWCFPFERLIGILQRINTNDHIGGELEGTIMKSYTRGANLRRWLNRPDCPEIIRQFKRLFDKAFSSSNSRDESVHQDAPKSKQYEHAHHTANGVVFSRSSTHLGNSLVLYYPTLSSSTPIAGSIQKIVTSSNQVYFHIKRQATLPRTKSDPFHRYPSFPATVYSSKMDDGPDDRVCPQSVLSHVARFEFSSERAVIVNLSRCCDVRFSYYDKEEVDAAISAPNVDSSGAFAFHSDVNAAQGGFSFGQ